MITKEEILHSITELENYILKNNYSGHDPYDALNSKILNEFNSKLIKILLTQTFVYSPINFRKILDISKSINPKSIGLILKTYCILYQSKIKNEKEFNEITKRLVKLLIETKSENYSGYCWGFNFNWQDITRYTEKGTPTVVITSFIGDSVLDLYLITRDETYLEIGKSISDFILNDLNITKTKQGICFSYTPIDNNIVHNANCLAASFLSRLYSITKKQKLIEYAQEAVDFSITQQEKDGSWAYSLNLEKNKKRKQIDFHQGYIIDSLINFTKNTEVESAKYMKSITRGADYYFSKQFHHNGKSKWRVPLEYPIDIHHQAQGIITASNLFELFKKEKYKEYANTISAWTIENMQSPNGYFYYQKWPIITNKISYMRWNQAWMFLALAKLLHNCW